MRAAAREPAGPEVCKPERPLLPPSCLPPRTRRSGAALGLLLAAAVGLVFTRASWLFTTDAAVQAGVAALAPIATLALCVCSSKLSLGAGGSCGVCKRAPPMPCLRPQPGSARCCFLPSSSQRPPYPAARPRLLQP